MLYWWHRGVAMVALNWRFLNGMMKFGVHRFITDNCNIIRGE
jgi:hypothetical protein